MTVHVAASGSTDIARPIDGGNVCRRVVSWRDREVELRYPVCVRDMVDALVEGEATPADRCCSDSITIVDEGDDHFSIVIAGEPSSTTRIARDDLAMRLIDALVGVLAGGLDTALAVHAGTVALNGNAILIAGASGAGKSSLVAWFVDNGYTYLTDELTAVTDDAQIDGFARGIVSKGTAAARIAQMPAFRGAWSISNGATTIIRAPKADTPSAPLTCKLIIFPQFEPGAALAIETLPPARTGLRLIGCNLNARNLRNDGFETVTALAQATPAIVLRYGAYEQLDGTLDVLSRSLLGDGQEAAVARQLLSILPNAGAPHGGDMRSRAHSPQAATPRGPAKRLTIGMATYDDYDGVYFTLQSLRLYHPEIVADTEFLVIDNHPGGPCAEPLKSLERSVPNYRYVPVRRMAGTAVRDALFAEAGGDYVLCLDCHVLLVPGAVKRLLDYFAAHPDTRDLLQGPLVDDSLDKITGSHMQPAWREGFLGKWAVDERANDPDGAPFEIPMQGLGLFACRRAAWLGFNPDFRGFGGEEGYIHEKFRRAGARTLCLPFLRWVHRFSRPMGVPYPNRWEDRLRNYIIGFREVGLPTTEMAAHFREHLGPAADDLIARTEDDIAQAQSPVS